MKTIAVDHRFFWPRQRFQDAIFFNDTFTRELDGQIGIIERHCLEEEDTPTFRRRLTRLVPKRDLPALVQKVLGASLSYLEDGIRYKNEHRMVWSIHSDLLPKKFKAFGQILFLEDGPETCIRRLEGTFEVSLFGVGGLLEGLIADSTLEAYKKSAILAERWIAQTNNEK